MLGARDLISHPSHGFAIATGLTRYDPLHLIAAVGDVPTQSRSDFPQIQTLFVSACQPAAKDNRYRTRISIASIPAWSSNDSAPDC
jgi:hypothetical protein